MGINFPKEVKEKYIKPYYLKKKYLSLGHADKYASSLKTVCLIILNSTITCDSLNILQIFYAKVRFKSISIKISFCRVFKQCPGYFQLIT